jgi:acetyltransferase-like isoleucine patch superfamily enzyme
LTTRPPNPFDHGYMSSAELRTLGFAAVGDNVRIAKNCTIIGLANIRIGSNVRIDDNVVIAAASGAVTLGDYIHVGAGCYLGAGGGITLCDFSNLSQGVRIYSKSDDYSGDHLTNPTVPEEYLGLEIAPVRIGRHVIVGSGSVILPGCELAEGASVGALSLVVSTLQAWTIYAGCPVREIRPRSRRALDLEARLRTQAAFRPGA